MCGRASGSPSSSETVGVQALEVVAADFAIRLAVPQHVVGNDKGAMGDGDNHLPDPPDGPRRLPMRVPPGVTRCSLEGYAWVARNTDGGAPEKASSQLWVCMAQRAYPAIRNRDRRSTMNRGVAGSLV